VCLGAFGIPYPHRTVFTNESGHCSACMVGSIWIYLTSQAKLRMSSGRVQHVLDMPQWRRRRSWWWNCWWGGDVLEPGQRCKATSASLRQVDAVLLLWQWLAKPEGRWEREGMSPESAADRGWW
jgi:hypothetical protein